MHEYDVALKGVLRRLNAGMLERVTGFAVKDWLNVELPEVRSSRADLLGETADGHLVHIELQSTNDSNMALRMAEYSLAICRRFRRFPSQMVLYVGERPLRMKTNVAGPHLSFECRMVDIREFDGEAWLASERVEDNVFAILMRFADQRSAILEF
jgi:hypothetical protein